MGLLNFNKKRRAEIEQIKAVNDNLRMQITDNNKLFKQFYNSLSGFFPLSKDSGLDDYIEKGYEGNTSIFGVISKLSLKAASVPAKIIQKQSNGKEIVLDWDDYPELKQLYKKPNYYQNGIEFRQNAFIYKYVTGNHITYAPKYENGINKGKITLDGLILIPTQDVDIYANGWRKIPDYYTLDIFQEESLKISVTDIWHERFPGLHMQEGKQFMGLSPLKAAVNIINSTNSGQKNMSNIYGQGHAPGVVFKKVQENHASLTPEQQRKAWQRNYKNSKEDQIPIFTEGEVGFAKVGSDDIASLRIIENDEHGGRVIAKVFGVDPSVFGDASASAYNNMQTAQKAMWEDRLIPDVNQYYEGFTEEIVYHYDSKLIVRANYDNIDSLQPDKAKKVVWVSKMFNDGIITGDEYLEKMGEEKTGLPEMQVRFSSFNRVPLSEVVNPSNDEGAETDDENKFYSDNNLKDKL